jgi:hypothetical protein
MGNPFIIAEDDALKAHLQGMVVADESNRNRQVKAWFGYPDVEVRQLTFPFVTIDLIDISPANERQTSGRLADGNYLGTAVPVQNHYYTYDVPVAYDLVYQITTYARNPRHDRAIMFQMLDKFPSKYGYLVVPEQVGSNTTSRSMFLDGFAKRDAVEGETGNRRLLRNIYTVRVISQMLPAAAQAIAVQTVNVNTTTPHIPSRYVPIH